jgi:hypothetical protein
LAFHKTYKIAKAESQKKSDLWDQLQTAYAFIKLFQFGKALELLESIKTTSKKRKEDVIYFITLFNIHSIKWKSFKSELPNLQNEINKLKLSDGERNLIESVYKYTVFDTYQNNIDKEYRQIIKYKNARYPNDTTDKVITLYNHFNEYLNFSEGNFIAINLICDFKTMVKKVIESLIISFSMNTKFSYHLISFNDHMIQYAVHYCEPNELLSYFQNNAVKSIPYISDDNYFNEALSNFFSKENVIFLKNETNYFDNRTKNPELGRKSASIFANLCILSGHLKFTIEDDNLLNKMEYFLREIDVSDHTASMLFYLINKDDFRFPSNELVQLIQLMIEDEHFKNSYLLTNLIRVFINRNMDNSAIGKKLKDNIITKSIKHPTNNIFEVLPGILDEEYKTKLIDAINVKLAENFNCDLYYHATKNDIITYNNKSFLKYQGFHMSLLSPSKSDSILDFPSPYTGIPHHKRNRLNQLTEVLIIHQDKIDAKNPIISDLKKLHRYYEFVLDIKNFNEDTDYDPLWLLENPSDIVLKKLATNKILCGRLRSDVLNHYNRYLSKIYISYVN